MSQEQVRHYMKVIFIKRRFTAPPLQIKTYLNLNDANDAKNGNIELSINQSSISFSQIYHCAGVVNSTGSITVSKGVGFTVSKTSTGIYVITFNSPHPSTVYIVSVTSNVSGRIVASINLTTTSVQVNTVTTGNNPIDTTFSFQVFL